MPYNPTDHTTWPTESAWRQAPLYRSQSGYGYMWVNSDLSIEDLKQFVTDENLAIIAVDANFYTNMTSNDLWTIDNYNPSGTNHANTIVGYDDNLGPYTESGNPNTYGAFEIANSWGVGGWEHNTDGFYYISYNCMKQRIQYIFLYQNYADYKPKTVAVFQLNHNKRGENRIDVGIGDTDLPDNIKSFDNFIYNGGNVPYPNNPIVVDITEFMPFVSETFNQFFMQVYDAGTSTTGTIVSFSIEMYDDYARGVPTNMYTSTEIPVSTIQNNTVYATLNTSCSLNLFPVNYELSNLSEGNEYYIDRIYTLTYIPDKYKGLNMIKTANDDKNKKIDFHFNLCSSNNIYIAYDHRLSIPPWMISDNYENTGDTLAISDSYLNYFNIWKRNVEPGIINFGNIGEGPDSAMYIVFYKPMETLPVNIKVFLQGPYDNNVHIMKTDINSILPFSDPYSQNESVGSIPSGVVDWILVELRSDVNTIVKTRAAFLMNDGSIHDIDGSDHINFSEVSGGDYYIVIKHRNHLAVMSANTVSLPNSSDYDFTTGNDKYYGGSSGAIQLETGVWGMIAGDANSDGSIDAVDKNNIWRVENGTTWSYTKYSDFNLDGNLDAVDKNNFWRPNNGLSSQVP